MSQLETQVRGHAEAQLDAMRRRAEQAETAQKGMALRLRDVEAELQTKKEMLRPERDTRKSTA